MGDKEQALLQTLNSSVADIETAVDGLETSQATMATQQTTMATQQTNMVTQQTAVVAQLTELNSGIPATATRLQDANATPVALAATPQVIIAAGGAGIAHYIRSAIFANVTAAEVAVLQLEDEDGNLLAGPFSVGDPAVAGKGFLVVDFKQPIKVTDNKGVNVACVGDIGDSTAQILGYTL